MLCSKDLDGLAVRMTQRISDMATAAAAHCTDEPLERLAYGSPAWLPWADSISGALPRVTACLHGGPVAAAGLEPDEAAVLLVMCSLASSAGLALQPAADARDEVLQRPQTAA